MAKHALYERSKLCYIYAVIGSDSTVEKDKTMKFKDAIHVIFGQLAELKKYFFAIRYSHLDITKSYYMIGQAISV